MRTQIAVLTAATLLLAGCSLLPPEAEQVTIDVAAPVVTQREVITVTRGAIQARLTVNIALGAEEQRSLYTRTSGRIRHLYVAPGQQVSSGQLLLELEPGNLPFDIESAQMDLQTARNTLNRALSRKGFVDAPSEADLEKYQNSVRSAEIKLERLQTQLADMRIYAPFAGQVVTVAAAEGAQADAYKEMILLAAAGPAVARATVDEQTAAAIRAGQKVEIFPNDGDPAPLPATVQKVPTIGTQDRTMIIRPDADSPRLRVGRNGRAEIILDARADALLVPQSAIRTYGGRTFVTVVEGESRQEVAVVLGLQSETHAEVLEGLREGQRVAGR